MRWICPSCDNEYEADMGNCPDDGSKLLPLKESDDPFVGQNIAGRFHVKKKLGEGGMGAVYLAHQASVDRMVVLKVLKGEFQEDVTVVKRFFLEAKAASRLSNEHTITIYDFDKTADGTLYIAMELLKGRELREKMDEVGRLSIDETAKILMAVSESLGEAHDAGIIHRDMKPENIFLTERGKDKEFVKVLDFGIARATDLTGTKMTRTGIVQGTPAYMAPEMIMSQDVDARADIYALGIMMYEMLSGVVPFEAETPMQMMMAHLQQAPQAIDAVAPDLTLPTPIHQFVWRCLDKRKENRPESAEAFREELQIALDQRGSSTSEKLKPIYVTGAGFRGANNTVAQVTESLGGAAPGSAEDDAIDDLAVDLSDMTGADDGVSIDNATEAYEQLEGGGSKKGMFIGLAIGLVLLLAVLGVFLGGGGDAEKPAELAKPAPTEPSPAELAKAAEATKAAALAKAEEAAKAAALKAKKEAETEPPKKEVPALVALTITSQPPGASILLSDQLVGKTPMMLKVPKDETAINLKLALKDHLPDESTLVPDEDKLVSRELKVDPATIKKAAPVRKKPTRKATTAKKTRPSTPKKRKAKVDDLLLD